MRTWWNQLAWASFEESISAKPLPLWKVAVRFIQKPGEGVRSWRARRLVVEGK